LPRISGCKSEHLLGKCLPHQKHHGTVLKAKNIQVGVTVEQTAVDRRVTNCKGQGEAMTSKGVDYILGFIALGAFAFFMYYLCPTHTEFCK